MQRWLANVMTLEEMQESLEAKDCVAMAMVKVHSVVRLTASEKE